MKGFKVIKVLQNGHMQRGLIVNYGASARYIFTTTFQFEQNLIQIQKNSLVLARTQVGSEQKKLSCYSFFRHLYRCCARVGVVLAALWAHLHKVD